MDRHSADIIKKNYTQIVLISCILATNFCIHPLEGSYIIHDHFDPAFLFPFQKDFGTFHELLFYFFYFFFFFI